MVDPGKILEEASKFQLFLAGGNTGLTPDEIHRQERYHHALDMIKKYSFVNKTARNVHSDRFTENGNKLSRRTIDNDFIIAYHLLGKEGLFNRDSNRNWGLYKIIQAIELSLNQNELKVLPKLFHEYYLLSDLNKNEIDLPDFSKINLPELRATLHPEVIRMKQDPKILAELVREFLKPKGEAKYQEAEIINESGDTQDTI